MWRVQAHWMVGEEAREYRPTFVASRWQARAATRRMRRDLWHFVGLVITVEQVDRATAETAMAEHAAAVADEPLPTIHFGLEGMHSAKCGEVARVGHVMMAEDFFVEVADSSRRCERCWERLQATPR
jgi:hypothetical protein